MKTTLPATPPSSSRWPMRLVADFGDSSLIINRRQVGFTGSGEGVTVRVGFADATDHSGGDLPTLFAVGRIGLGSNRGFGGNHRASLAKPVASDIGAIHTEGAEYAARLWQTMEKLD